MVLRLYPYEIIKHAPFNYLIQSTEVKELSNSARSMITKQTVNDKKYVLCLKVLFNLAYIRM